MAKTRRYLRSQAWHPKGRGSIEGIVPRPAPRLSPGLMLALLLSALFTLATLLLLIRSWFLDAPASEADRMVALGVGGLTWLTSLGYYALWQLDKQLRPPIIEFEDKR